MVAFVTGAARGIGRRVALTLAERGYAVAANDLDPPERTLDELNQAGAEALSVPGDVSDEGAVRAMVEAVMDGFGRVDVLVNNAGISLIMPAEETTTEDWRRVIEVNLTGCSCRAY
jgi:NAD(P)-dependent dehydrogenase (short-subunit alcohol dehydrogenase family)